MPRILVPLAVSRTPSADSISTHFARDTYVQKLVSRGLEPVFVAAPFTSETVRRAYELCDGVLMTGGLDVDSARYGAEPHATLEREDIERDKLELDLIKEIMRDKKPFFGICRGCQVLAVAQGGTLIQHLPEAFPGEAHGVSEGGTYDSMRDPATHHAVHIEADSRAAKLLGKTEIRVPTGHHQAVDKPGDGVRIVGRSPAGVVELLEAIDPSHWCVAVQGHPEIQDAAGDMEPLFDSFAAATKAWEKEHHPRH